MAVTSFVFDGTILEQIAQELEARGVGPDKVDFLRNSALVKKSTQHDPSHFLKSMSLPQYEGQYAVVTTARNRLEYPDTSSSDESGDEDHTPLVEEAEEPPKRRRKKKADDSVATEPRKKKRKKKRRR